MKNNMCDMADKDKSRSTALLFACVTVYFLCFILSESLENYHFPEWMYQTYRNL